MTKKELIAKLKAEYLEEVKGVKEYVLMIEEIAPCDPTGKYRKILNAILKDEMEHQEYLLKVLVDMDAFIPEDVSTAMAEMNALKAKM